MANQTKKHQILVTGFDPFDGQAINPSWQAVSSLPDEIAGCCVHKLLIPTVFGKAGETVLQCARLQHPDYIFMVGQAGLASSVTPEQVGYNIRNARIPDNEGNQPRDQLIVPDGPMCLTTSIPLTTIVTKMKEEGYNIDISSYAGSFVCNDVFFTVLHAFKGTSVTVDFIHVPSLPEQVSEGSPCMSLDSIRQTLIRFIELVVKQ